VIDISNAVELLAQAMWKGSTGEREITAAWVLWAQTHNPEATALRNQATAMINIALGQLALPTAVRSANQTSLDWLFQ
jgi:hypothetical protein